jgi:EAL domain-containing protein (putative c-di-GMP-specific phosphodiesterase class I)
MNDLILVMDRDPESLSVLRSVAEKLCCDRVEVDSLETLQGILAIRHPTIAVLAVDGLEVPALAVLQALADHSVRAATFLVASLSARVFASVRRAAETRGLNVAGVCSRPLDAGKLEGLLTAHLTPAAPISRQELEQALATPELSLLYQPKIALSSEGLNIQGVEALVRWQHPRRGLLRPRQFLRAVEDHQLLTSLTDFVMTEALRQAGQWRARGLRLEMVINLSPGLVRDGDFPERLACLLRENEVPPDQLVLDLTEASSAVDSNLMLDVFTRLRILGVGLALDNFGTGLSSLTELYRLPYSEIKVDHSLMADVPRKREAMLIVRAIVDLAHTLQLAVCAEGIETMQMLEFARNSGFDTAQGRLFSDPVPGAEIERIVHTWPGFGPGSTGSWRAVDPLRVDHETAAHQVLAPPSAKREGS